MQQVEIHIRGELDPSWSEWFDGFSIRQEGTNITILSGKVIDQTVLYGLIRRLNQLGIELILLSCRDIPFQTGKKP